MDIKEKFKSFMDKQKSSLTLKSPVSGMSENENLEELESRLAVLSQAQRKKSSLINDQFLTPEAEQAIIASIDEIYFNVDEEEKDVSEHELEKFCDLADLHVISGMRSRLRKQQAIVTRRVSSLIIQKQMLCTEEMDKVYFKILFFLLFISCH